MPASVQSPADLINLALRGIGYNWRVSHLYDGSAPGKVALDIYAQTRDALLCSKDWPFARGPLALTLLKGPPPAGGYNPIQPWGPTYPPPGFLYEYLYPDDCLESGALIQAGPMFDLDPKPALFRIDNDNTLVDRDGAPTTAKKVILANLPNAILVYIRQVTDMTLWEPGFVEALVDKLKPALALSLEKSIELAKLAVVETPIAVAAADARPG